jgi:hypothetical protein
LGQMLRNLLVLVMVSCSGGALGGDAPDLVLVAEGLGGVNEGTVFKKLRYLNTDYGKNIPVWSVFGEPLVRGSIEYLVYPYENIRVSPSHYSFFNSTPCTLLVAEPEKVDIPKDGIKAIYQLTPTQALVLSPQPPYHNYFLDWDNREIRRFSSLPTMSCAAVDSTGFVYSNLSGVYFHDRNSGDRELLFKKSSARIRSAWRTNEELVVWYSQGNRNTEREYFKFSTKSQQHVETPETRSIRFIGPGYCVTERGKGYGLGRYRDHKFEYIWFHKAEVWAARYAFCQRQGILAVIEFQERDNSRILSVFNALSGDLLLSKELEYNTDNGPMYFDSQGYLHLPDALNNKDLIYWVKISGST